MLDGSRTTKRKETGRSAMFWQTRLISQRFTSHCFSSVWSCFKKNDICFKFAQFLHLHAITDRLAGVCLWMWSQFISLSLIQRTAQCEHSLSVYHLYSEQLNVNTIYQFITCTANSWMWTQFISLSLVQGTAECEQSLSLYNEQLNVKTVYQFITCTANSSGMTRVLPLIF
jgi:hypothetical protein